MPTDALAPSWAEMRLAYEAARAAEDAYDAEHINPLMRYDLPAGPERNAAFEQVPQAVWEESERLQDVRCAAEDALLALPSPHAAAFALKVLICRGRGRDLSSFDDMLEEEAAAFLAAHQSPERTAA